MSEPLVTATSTPAAVQAAESMLPTETSAGSPRADGPAVLVTPQASAFNRRMMLAGGVCVLAIVALIALPGSSRVEAPATLHSQENVVVTPIEEQVVVRPIAHARLTPAAKVPSDTTASSQLEESPVVASGPAEPTHVHATTINEPIAASPVVAHAVVRAEPVEEATATLPTVTVTGCLEKRDDSFRLTDTDGDAAPKSRSWKSGFLAKRPAAVELLDTASNLWLAAQVGQRISATGTLDDRELHVRSVRRATGACQ